MATLATPFEALPHPALKMIVDRQGDPVDLDLYDPEMWRARNWSVFSPEVIARVRAATESPEAGDRAVADLQAQFVRNLRRAGRFQRALTGPLPAQLAEVATFGGDCKMTPARGMLIEDGNGSRVLFRPNENSPGRVGESGKKSSKSDRLDYEALLAEPGDGLVTRASQVGRDASLGNDALADFHRLPIAQTFFLCETHEALTGQSLLPEQPAVLPAVALIARNCRACSAATFNSVGSPRLDARSRMMVPSFSIHACRTCPREVTPLRRRASSMSASLNCSRRRRAWSTSPSVITCTGRPSTRAWKRGKRAAREPTR